MSTQRDGFRTASLPGQNGPLHQLFHTTEFWGRLSSKRALSTYLQVPIIAVRYGNAEQLRAAASRFPAAAGAAAAGLLHALRTSPHPPPGIRRAVPDAWRPAFWQLGYGGPQEVCLPSCPCDHEHVGAREEDAHPASVLPQAPAAHLRKAEGLLEDVEDVLHMGPHARLPAL